MKSQYNQAVHKFACNKLLDTEKLDSEWSYLEEAIDIIFDKQILEPNQYMKLDKIVRFLCNNNCTDWLYEKLISKLDGYIDSFVHTLSIYDTTLSDQAYKYILNINTLYSQFTKVRSIFLYLERDFLIVRKDYMTIQDIAICKFRSYLTRYTALKDKLIQCIIQLIDQERLQTAKNEDMILGLKKILITNEIYSEFEDEFLRNTDSYYEAQARENVESLSVKDYLDYSTKVYEMERRIAKEYLEISTHEKLIKIVVKNVIQRYSQDLLNKGFVDMMDLSKYNQLKSLYCLLNKASQGNTLEAHLRSYILDRVNKFISSEDSPSLIEDFIRLSSKIHSIILECFSHSTRLRDISKESFRIALIDHGNTMAYILSTHIDSLLKPAKSKTEESVIASLNSCLFLFEILSVKDVFQEYYCKFLSKRLIYEGYITRDLEQTVLAQLTKYSYDNYTERMNSMLKDIELSDIYMQEFFTSKQNQNWKLEYYVKVLNPAKWPKYERSYVVLPDDMQSAQDVYSQYFGTIQKSKTLIWKHNLSYCIIHFRTDSGKILQCTLYQTLILLLFNNYSFITLDVIENLTGISPHEAKKHILPLYKGKFRLLLKTGSMNQIAESDLFTLNSTFNPPMRRLNFSQLLLESTKDIRNKNHRKTLSAIADRRKEQIEASIVRIMKNRKNLKFSDIFTELLNSLHFPLTHSDLKERLESLIAKEYLSYSPSSMQEYIYIP